MQDNERHGDQTNNSSLFIGDKAPHAADMLSTFLQFFPPNIARQTLWQLHVAALGGRIADAWEEEEREMQVLFYHMLGELVEALPELQ